MRFFFIAAFPAITISTQCFSSVGKLQMLLKFGAVSSVDIGNQAKRYKQAGADVRRLRPLCRLGKSGSLLFIIKPPHRI